VLLQQLEVGKVFVLPVIDENQIEGT
jgi:hypothetical protein